MPPANVTDILDGGEQQAINGGVRKTTLRANWRILAVTLYMGMSLFEYGFDKGAIAGFQSMPGFLKLFGYQTPGGKWAIEVSYASFAMLMLADMFRPHLSK
jgi:hypothetical protein